MNNKEKTYIESNLPKTIVRHGSDRKLEYYKSDDEYNIWYGTIISGNFMTEANSLELAVEQMKEYIEKYKDMDEYTFSNLGIKKGICLHCKVSLVNDRVNEYHCPKCKLCYDKIGFINGMLLKLGRWIFSK